MFKMNRFKSVLSTKRLLTILGIYCTILNSYTGFMYNLVCWYRNEVALFTGCLILWSLFFCCRFYLWNVVYEAYLQSSRIFPRKFALSHRFSRHKQSYYFAIQDGCDSRLTHIRPLSSDSIAKTAQSKPRVSVFFPRTAVCLVSAHKLTYTQHLSFGYFHQRIMMLHQSRRFVADNGNNRLHKPFSRGGRGGAKFLALGRDIPRDFCGMKVRWKCR